MKLKDICGNRQKAHKITAAFAILLAALLLATGCASKSAAPAEPDPSAGGAAESQIAAFLESAEAETEPEEAEVTEAKNAEVKEEEAVAPEEPEETEAEPEEAAEPEVIEPEDTSDIENNGGYFVRNGDYVYFRVYGPDGLAHNALWGEFMQPVTGGTSAMWRLDLKTNRYEKLFDDAGYGGIWFFQDLMWLNRSTDFGNIVYSVNPDTLESWDLAWGEICGVSADGSHLVYEGHRDDGAQAFYITGEEEMDQVVYANENEYLDYCGVVGRDLFFISHNYESDTTRDEFWQLCCDDETGEAELIQLGTFPEPEWYSSALFKQFLADGDKVYLSVEYQEGTGHFYAGSHYAVAESGKENSMKLLDDEADEASEVIRDELLAAGADEDYILNYLGLDQKTLKMYIGQPGELCFAPHLAGDLEVVDWNGAQDLVLYDSPLVLRPEDAVMICDNWLPEFEYNDEDDIRCIPQVTECVDNKVFTVYAEAVRTPDEDVGWRYAYGLKRTNYEYFDPADADTSDTGSLRHIDSVEAARWLTPEEVSQLNSELDWDYNGFFLSDYHDPTEIRWSEVFYNGAGIDTRLSAKQTKEYLEQTGEEELYTDVTAIAGKDIRSFVRRTTGTSYDDAEHPLSDSWDYMPEYDLYLFMHGDTNAQEIVFDNGWYLGDDTYRLRYTVAAPDLDYNEWPYAVTFRIEDGQWVFISNLPE